MGWMLRPECVKAEQPGPRICPGRTGDGAPACRHRAAPYGRLNPDKSNVILFPTWATGTTDQLSGRPPHRAQGMPRNGRLPARLSRMQKGRHRRDRRGRVGAQSRRRRVRRGRAVQEQHVHAQQVHRARRKRRQDAGKVSAHLGRRSRLARLRVSAVRRRRLQADPCRRSAQFGGVLLHQQRQHRLSRSP